MKKSNMWAFYKVEKDNGFEFNIGIREKFVNNLNSKGVKLVDWVNQNIDPYFLCD